MLHAYICADYRESYESGQAKTTHLKLLFPLILCYVMIALRLFLPTLLRDEPYILCKRFPLL